MKLAPYILIGGLLFQQGTTLKPNRFIDGHLDIYRDNERVGYIKENRFIDGKYDIYIDGERRGHIRKNRLLNRFEIERKKP